MAEVAPGPAPATVEDAIAAEVEAIQDELRRVDSRLRALAWGGGAPARRVAERWDHIALGLPDDARTMVTTSRAGACKAKGTPCSTD